MEFEFSWMTYFLSLFALMVCSIALTLLCPVAGKRNDGAAHERSADVSSPAKDLPHGTLQQTDRSAAPDRPDDGA